MKTRAQLIAPLTAVAILSGCAGGSSVKFSDLFDESARAEGTGVQGSSLVRAVVILATHEASAKQRAVAEQNGRRAVAKLQARIAAEEKTAPRVKPAGGKKPRRKLPRVIAIVTEKDSQTNPKAAKAVMLFDTHSQQIVGSKVYDIESEPRAGEDVRFETHSASYLGASL